MVMFNGSPVIDFSQPQASCLSGYYFSYTDPNDPAGVTYDVRWTVISNVNTQFYPNPPQPAASRRIILGVFRPGMQTPTLPITLDVQVEK